MGDYIVLPLAKSEETIGYRSDYAEAIRRATDLSLSEHAPYVVYIQKDENNDWELIGTAYEGVFTLKQSGEDA